MFFQLSHSVLYNMNYCYIHYHKYDIGFTRYSEYSYLTTTFKCENKSYITKKRTSKRNNVRNIQFICDLKNKYSLINSELIKAINIFNRGRLFYPVSKKNIRKNIKSL